MSAPQSARDENPGPAGPNRTRTRPIILGVGGALALGGLVFVGATALDLWPHSGPAAVGDCLAAHDASGGTGATGRRASRAQDRPVEPRVVDCDDDEAAHVVLGEIPPMDDQTACLDVAGATTAVATTEPQPRSLCAGPVDTDPALSVNTVTPGGCVVITGDTARRADCDDPASARVLGVLDAGSTVPSVFDGELAPCIDSGFDDTEALYTWSLETDHASRLSFDRGLCLAGEGNTT